MLDKNKKWLVYRFIFGQFPLLLIWYIVLRYSFLSFPFYVQLFIGCIAFINLFVIVRMNKKIIRKHINAQKKTQVTFILISGMMCLIGLYRAITVADVYQRVIGYSVAFICLVLTVLLMIGLKYISKSN